MAELKNFRKKDSKKDRKKGQNKEQNIEPQIEPSKDINKDSRNKFLLNQNKTKNLTSFDDKSPENALSVSRKISRHKMLIFYRILFAVIAVIVMIAIAYFSWVNKTYTDYDVTTTVSWERAQNATCMPLGNNIFSYSKDGMTCTDAKGTTLWNVTFEMQEPIIRICKNIIAIGDYNGRTIYICDTSKQLGQIDTTIPIRDFSVSANGVVTAILDDSNITSIYMYDVSGNELAYFKTTMSKSGYPLALGISDNSQQVAISYLNAANGSASSNVAFYNFSEVGQNYTDNLVGGYGYSDAVVPFITFMNNQTVFAVADNRLMIYQGAEIPKNTADVVLQEEVQSIFYNEQYIGLVYFSVDGNSKYKMDIYDINGKKVNTFEFDLEYTDILFTENSAIIYNDSECEIYNWKGALKYKGNFKEAVYTMIPTTSITKYVLVTENAIQTIELK